MSSRRFTGLDRPDDLRSEPLRLTRAQDANMGSATKRERSQALGTKEMSPELARYLNANASLMPEFQRARTWVANEYVLRQIMEQLGEQVVAAGVAYELLQRDQTIPDEEWDGCADELAADHGITHLAMRRMWRSCKSASRRYFALNRPPADE